MPGWRRTASNLTSGNWSILGTSLLKNLMLFWTFSKNEATALSLVPTATQIFEPSLLTQETYVARPWLSTWKPEKAPLVAASPHLISKSGYSEKNLWLDEFLRNANTSDAIEVGGWSRFDLGKSRAFRILPLGEQWLPRRCAVFPIVCRTFSSSSTLMEKSAGKWAFSELDIIKNQELPWMVNL